MIGSSEQFRKISETGRQVLLLKNIGRCSCDLKSEEKKSEEETDGWNLSNGWSNGSEKESLNTLADNFDNFNKTIFCEKCFSTGIVFLTFLTPKIRYTNHTKVNKKINLFSNEDDFFSQSENMMFFFSSFYKHIEEGDYICCLKHDSENKLIKPIEVESVFKVGNINSNFENDFIYFDVVCHKKFNSDLIGKSVDDLVLTGGAI